MKSRNLFQIYRNSHWKKTRIVKCQNHSQPLQLCNLDSRVTKGLRTWHCGDSGIQPALTTLPGLMENPNFANGIFGLTSQKMPSDLLGFKICCAKILPSSPHEHSVFFANARGTPGRWFPNQKITKTPGAEISHTSSGHRLCNLSGMNGMKIKKEKKV